MANDVLIRVGDGVTNEWVMSPSNTGITGVFVDGMPVGFTQPTWNKVKLDMTPAKGAEVQINFTGLEGGSAAAQVDLTPISDALINLQMALDNVQYGVYTVQSDVSNVGAAVAAAGGGAVSGEVKLFALQGGKGAPAGWELDTYRAPAIPGAIVAAYGIDKAASVYVGQSYVQVGNVTYSNFAQTSPVTTTRDLYASEPFSGVKTKVATLPTVYSGAGSKPVVLGQLNGKVIVAGGFSTTTTAYTRMDEFNPATGVFTQLANLPVAVSDFAMVELDPNRLLIVGGSTGAAANTAVAGLHVYTRSTNTWQTLASTLSAAATLPRAAKLPSGKVLILGGYNGTAVLQNYYLFDPTTLTLGEARQTSFVPALAVSLESTTFRTTEGAAYRYSRNEFCEYNEATGTFAPWVFKPISSLMFESNNANYSVCGSDLSPSAHGHVLFTQEAPLVLMQSQAVPTYRYMRKS